MASAGERYGHRQCHWWLQRPKMGLLDDEMGEILAEKDARERIAAELSKVVETGRGVGGYVWT